MPAYCSLVQSNMGCLNNVVLLWGSIPEER